MIKIEVIEQNINFLERLEKGNILYVKVSGDLRAKNSKNPWFSRNFGDAPASRGRSTRIEREKRSQQFAKLSTVSLFKGPTMMQPF